MPRHFLYIEMWIEAIEAPGQTMKFNGNGIREWVREMGDWENWRKSGGGKKDTHKAIQWHPDSAWSEITKKADRICVYFVISLYAGRTDVLMLSFFLSHSLPLSRSSVVFRELSHSYNCMKSKSLCLVCNTRILGRFPLYCIVCVCVHIGNEKRINATFIYFKGWTGILTD